MTTSADLVNFWENFTQTALNKDAGPSLPRGLSASPQGASSTGATTSFVSVPSKINYYPVASSGSPSKKSSTGVSKFVASFGRGVAKTTGAAVAQFQSALQNAKQQQQQQQHNSGSDGDIRGGQWGAGGGTYSVPPAPGSVADSALAGQTLLAGGYATASYGAQPAPATISAISTSPASSSTFVNFRDIIVPYLLHDLQAALAPATGAPANELSASATAVVARWPGVLPPDSHWYAMNQLRIHAGAPERSENGIARLLEYFSILQWIESRFPIETSQGIESAALGSNADPTRRRSSSGDTQEGLFTWFEAFDSKKTVTTNCIQYEKACVLFNVAAVHSQLAANQQIWTRDGIKVAAQHFQRAAGVFSHIRDTLVPRFRIQLEKTSDLHPATVHALVEVMLAQAHECFVEKANIDAASSTLTSQIAAQTAEHYDLAYRAAFAELPVPIPSTTGNKSSAKDDPNVFAALKGALNHNGGGGSGGKSAATRFPQSWISALHGKALMYTGLAHFHAPATLGPAVHAIGERLARLIIAKTLADRAVTDHCKSAGGMTSQLLEYYAGQVGAALHVAEVENVQNYQVSVVDPRHLTPLRRLAQSCVAPQTFAEPAPVSSGSTPSAAGASHMATTSAGLVLEHAAFADEEQSRAAWRRCVVVLADLAGVMAEAQSAVGAIDDAESQIRAVSATLLNTGFSVNGTPLQRTPVQGSMADLTGAVGGIAFTAAIDDETQVLALAHTLSSLAADERVLPTHSLLQSVSQAAGHARAVLARATATLDRAEVNLSPRTSPSTAAKAADLRARIAPLAASVANLSFVAERAAAAVSAPGGECAGFKPTDWVGDRVVQLGQQALAGGTCGASVTSTATPALTVAEDAVRELMSIRSDLSSLLQELGTLSVDLSKSGVPATVARAQTCVDCYALQLRPRVTAAVRRAEAAANDRIRTATVAAAAGDARRTLFGVANKTKRLSEVRAALESAAADVLESVEACEATVAEAAAIPRFAAEEDAATRARFAAASAPPLSDLQHYRSGGDGGMSGTFGGGGSGECAADGGNMAVTEADRERHRRLAELQQRLNRRVHADTLRTTAVAAAHPSPPPEATSRAATAHAPRMFSLVRDAVKQVTSMPMAAAATSPRKPVPASSTNRNRSPTADSSASSHSEGTCGQDADTDDSAPVPAPVPRVPQGELARALAAHQADVTRGPHVDSWAAEQVAQAALRKKLWKMEQQQQQHQAAPRHSSSSRRTHEHQRGAADPHHQQQQQQQQQQQHPPRRHSSSTRRDRDQPPRESREGHRHSSSSSKQKKSDSGFTAAAALAASSHSGVIMDMSETVSQMKLQTDAMLSQLTSATAPATASGERSRRESRSRRI